MISRILFVFCPIFLSRFGRKSPLRVMHFCTFRCNLNCKYCGIWKVRRKEMSTEEVKRAMREFAKGGTIFWTFTGGEPLLRQDIGELINYAKRLFPIVTLTTNGLLLKKRINEVKNVNYFTISLDGPKEVNDYTRGKGSFNKALESIKIARKIGKEVVINAVISRANIQNDFKGIKELIRLALNLGCKLNFSTLYVDQFNKDDKNILDFFPAYEENRRALDLIKRYKRKFNFILFSNACIECLKTQKRWSSCFAGRLFCDLFPDGTVIPCLFKEKNGINGLKHGFLEAFNKLQRNEYCVCSSTCYTELNCIFSFRPMALIENSLKYITFVR